MYEKRIDVNTEVSGDGPNEDIAYQINITNYIRSNFELGMNYMWCLCEGMRGNLNALYIYYNNLVNVQSSNYSMTF